MYASRFEMERRYTVVFLFQLEGAPDVALPVTSNIAAASAEGAAAAAAVPVETDIDVAGPHTLLPDPAAPAPAARPSKVLSASGMVWTGRRFLEAKRDEAVDDKDREKPCCHLGKNKALVELPMSAVVVGTNAVTVLVRRGFCGTGARRWMHTGGRGASSSNACEMSSFFSAKVAHWAQRDSPLIANWLGGTAATAVAAGRCHRHTVAGKFVSRIVYLGTLPTQRYNGRG